MRCAEVLTTVLSSHLSPEAFFQGSSEADEQELRNLAASAEKFIKRLPEYVFALQDLKQRGVRGVACDITQSLLHEKDAVKGAEQGDFLLAARQFTTSLAFIDERQHPKRASTCFANRALCLLQLQQHSNAAEDCLAALTVHSDSARAHFLRAVALQRLQQYTEAERHARSAASSEVVERLPPSAAHDAARLLADLQKLAHSAAAGLQGRPSTPDAVKAEPCTSMPSLEVRQTVAEGRTLCMKSTEGAEAGAILMQEVACSAVVMKQHRKAVRSTLLLAPGPPTPV